MQLNFVMCFILLIYSFSKAIVFNKIGETQIETHHHHEANDIIAKGIRIYSTSNANLLKSVTHLMDCFLQDYRTEENLEKQSKNINELDLRAQLEGSFFFSCIWAFGGVLDSNSKEQFNVLFRGLLEKEFPENLYHLFNLQQKVLPPKKPYIYTVPKDGFVFDYKYIKEGKGKWKLWSDELLNVPPIPRDIPVNQIIVPTIKTVRYMNLIKLLVQNGKSVLFIGSSGTGKSAYITDFLQTKSDKSLLKHLIINFSAKTCANDLQDLIMSKLDKRKKGVYGPPVGKRWLIFIDDVSMLLKDAYGSQPPLELLRQLLDHSQWYDKKEKIPIKLIDVQLICAMNPPECKEDDVSERFKRHFFTLAISPFDDQVIVAIFSKVILWHLDTRGFSKEFDPCINQIVSATLNIYRECLKNLLPVPTKSHYLFNLRDFSRVIQGVLLSVPESMPTLESMKRLWIHEVLRVFGDRLTDQTDKNWLINQLYSTVELHMDTNFDVLFDDLAVNSQPIGVSELRKLIFCDFIDPKADVKLYKEVSDLELLKSVVESYLIEYNAMMKKPMNLILYRYAIENLAKICRVIKQPQSHVILVGIGGSGRQSLIRLSTHICGYDLFNIEMNKFYNYDLWQEDMKKLLHKSTTSETHNVFYVSDIQLTNHDYLEDVNNLINTGEISTLYSVEEKNEISEMMRPIDRQREKVLQTDGSLAELYQLFVQKIREQLHISISTSSIDPSFRETIRIFPAIFKCSHIIWLQQWPKDAFLDVASTFLADQQEITESNKNSVLEMCYFLYTSTENLSKEFEIRLKRFNYVTPTSYFQMMNTFKQLLNVQKKEILDTKCQYEACIDRLNFTENLMNEMQSTLKELQPLLVPITQDIQQIVRKVEEKNLEISELQKIIQSDEETTLNIEKEAESLKAECDESLSTVTTIYEEALSALNILTAADIIFVKSMKSPSDTVKLIMEAVCILKKINPEKSQTTDGKPCEDYWKTSVKILGDSKFLDSLIYFDKDNIPEGIVNKIQNEYLPNPNFEPEKVKNSAVACESLFKWIYSVIEYNKVIKMISPKKQTLDSTQNSYSESFRKLIMKRNQLCELEVQLKTLETSLTSRRGDYQKIVDKMTDYEHKIKRAEELTANFESESSKWTQRVQHLNEKYDLLLGDVLIASGFVCYLGLFTSAYRLKQVNLWIEQCRNLQIKCTKDFALKDVLGDSISIKSWLMGGLSSDTFVIDNAIIISNRHSNRWPLIIDPQNEANCWIKSMERINDINTIRLNQPDHLKNLENAIQYGHPVLLENVGEQLDCLLDPILLNQKFKQANVMFIKLGDSAVEFNSNFRLYITTKLENPHYLPETAMKLTIINFAVSTNSLEEQIVDLIISKERPDLKAEKLSLGKQEAANEKLLKEAEEKVRGTLAKSVENILDDEEVIATLTSSKVAINDVQAKQSSIRNAEKAIISNRAEYKSAASYLAMLFFTIDTLSQVNPMYQYSLQWFTELIKSSLDSLEQAESTELRLNQLKINFTKSLYHNVCNSLFQKDRLLFSMLLTINTLKQRSDIPSTQVTFLLTGGGNYVANLQPHQSSWCSDEQWKGICRLDTVPGFEGIRESFEANAEQWRTVFDSKDVQAELMPHPFDKLTRFEVLLLVRCLRKDLLLSAAKAFVQSELGPEFVTHQPATLPSIYKTLSSSTPLIFILGFEQDVLQKLLRLGEQMGVAADNIFHLSLAQNQETVAIDLMNDGMRNGSWIILQNCHLANSWLEQIEDVYDDGFSRNIVNPDFRLMLTSYPIHHFPINILQNGTKVTNDLEHNLRSNLISSYSNDFTWDEEFFESSKQTKIFKKLLYSLCFLHAILNERSSFGSTGWNVPYEFNELDLQISINQLYLLNKCDDFQFEAYEYFIEDCVYGGRICDVWDQRTLQTIFTSYFSREVMNGNKYFFEETSGVYCCPDSEEHSGFINHMGKLPLDDPASVFGLDDNVNLMKHQREAAGLMSSLLSAHESSQLLENSNGKGVSLVTKILDRLPANDLHEALNDKYSESHHEFMKVILIQEISQFNKLLRCIRTSLDDVRKATEGFVAVSNTLEETYDSISRGEVPKLWQKCSYLSLLPLGSYVDDFLKRLQFLMELRDEGPPKAYWIPGFFHPEALLTRILQTFARENAISFELLNYESIILKGTSTNEAPSKGIYVYGFYLENARFDEEKMLLADSLRNQIHSELPYMWLVPKEVGETPTENTYTCPVYKTAERRGDLSTTGHSTNFIMTLNLPTTKPEAFWILKGVAAICEKAFQS